VGLGNQDATFGQVDLDAFKYGFTMKASSELLADNAVNIVEFMGRRGGEALGNGIGAAFVTGTGSSQPRGILAASGGLATQAARSTSVANGFNYDDVMDLVHSVLRPYRNGSVFIANDSTVKTLRKLREGSGTGQYLWQPALTAGAPDTLAGYPILADPAMPTVQTNGTKGLVFGNISKAVIVRFAGPVRVESSTDFAFDTDLTTWRFIVRVDSEVVDANAAKALTYTT
jgi:HK97 family phage major capsid protein